MKQIVFCFLSCVVFASTAHSQAADRGAPDPTGMFGMGVQIASTTSLLFSWQTADQNPYGRSWRIEPSIAFSSSDNEESNGHTVSANLTLGLGVYMRWKVRAPFDNLYFTFGPRVTVTGYTSSSNDGYYINDSTFQTSRVTEQHFVTNLSIQAGPEYAFDQWSQHFSIAGYFSAGATITGKVKFIGAPIIGSTWNLSTTTGTGIVLRYYFM